MAQTQVVEVKKWYQSKIALFSLALLGVSGGNLLTGFLSTQVTPEQLDAIRTAYPQAVEIIHRLQSGESILSVAGAIIGVLIFVFRVWFTDSLVKHSIKVPGTTR